MTPRMRTINEAYNEIKANDPSTAITPYAIRQLVLDGKIPSVKAGKKYLLSLDALQSYLANPVEPQNRILVGAGIRKVPERM